MKEYPLFEKWTQVLDWILTRVESYPKSVRLTFSNRIANLALDTLEKIIEAIYNKKRLHILYSVNLYMEKLRIFMRLSLQRKYISIKQYEYIIDEINEAGKMTGGWIKKERREANQ